VAGGCLLGAAEPPPECSAGPISTQLNNNLTSAYDESSGCWLAQWLLWLG
jgi:hypothetical protein